MSKYPLPFRYTKIHVCSLLAERAKNSQICFIFKILFTAGGYFASLLWSGMARHFLNERGCPDFRG